jgi:hypothetical protein
MPQLDADKVEHRSQHQYHLDRQIRIERLPARRVPPWRLPFVEGGFIDPECQIAASPQAGLVGPPIADTGSAILGCDDGGPR